MHQVPYRSAYWCAGLAVFVAGAITTPRAVASERAQAQEPAPVRASMQCDRASEPGRVRCTVEAHAEGGRAMPWSDVEIVAVPEFATALKGRIGNDDATTRDGTTSKWAFGLVARKAGQGEVRARVRATVCAGETRCVPVTVDVRAVVIVG